MVARRDGLCPWAAPSQERSVCLKRIGYQDYCSLECHVEGDPNVEIAKSFKFLKAQWEEATV